MANVTDLEKKVFDVAPPPQPEMNPAASSPEPSRQMAADPSKREDAGSHQDNGEPATLSVTRDSDEQVATDIDKSSNAVNEVPEESHPAFTITEPSSKAENETPPSPMDDIKSNASANYNAVIPSVNPLPDTQSEPSAETAGNINIADNPIQASEISDQSGSSDGKNIEKQNLKQADDLAAPERFAATDALPDPIEKSTTAAKDNMQDPKIFDTKEYIVPIGDVNHKHGHLKQAIIFGVIFAILVVGGGLLYVVKFGK